MELSQYHSKKSVIVLFLVLTIFHHGSPGFCSLYKASDINVSCDRWPDCSSLERFGNDCVRIANARTNEEKVIAVWRFIQQCTERGHHPKEPAYGNYYILSPLKLLNVYGVHHCDGLSRIMTMTWRALGYRAEKLYKFGHTLADCRWKDEDGISRWHVFDVAQHWYVYDRTGSHIATPDELTLDHSLIYFPSKTPIPGWPSLMQPGYVHAGHLKIKPPDTGISLREGETIEWHWGNEDKPYYNLFGKRLKKDFEHGPYPITYGNGRLVYTPDLTGKDFERGLFQKPVNLTLGERKGFGPALHPQKPDRKAVTIFKISLPYIISDAWLNAKLTHNNPDDEIRFSLSVNGGRNWRPFWQTEKELGPIQLDHVSFCRPFNPSEEKPPEISTPFGRYDYLIKVEMKAGEEVVDCGLNSLSVVTVFQHNLFSLPMLRPGKNIITVRGNLEPESMLRVTYIWDDAGGREQKHIAETGITPFRYEIIARGDRWEDVICHSLKIEVLPRGGKNKSATVQKKSISPFRHTSTTGAFPATRSIGKYYPGPMKGASFYISEIEKQLTIQKDHATDNAILKNLSKKIGHNVLALAALQDPKAKDVLEKVIESDRTHPYKNKVWACQALFQSVGQLAAPMMIRILKRDDGITWHDPKGRWSQDAMWLRTASMASAVLAQIRYFEGKEHAADLIAGILEGRRTGTDPRKIWRGNEICWGLIKSLGKLGNKKHIPLLKKFLKEDSDSTAVAIQALSDIGDPSVVPDLLRLLRHFKYSPNGLYAIGALGKMGTKEIGPYLYPFLSYWDEDFRGASASALGEIGDLNAIPKLKEMMSRESFPWVVLAARKSLQALGGSCNSNK